MQPYCTPASFACQEPCAKAGAFLEMRPVALPTRRSVRWIVAAEDAFTHEHLGHERFAQGLGHIFLQASVQTVYRQGSEALLLHLHGRERRCERGADAGIIEPDDGNVLRDAVSEP